MIARVAGGGGGVVAEVLGRKEEEEEEGRGVYTGGWGGDADFHSSNPGATKGKQGEDGVMAEDGERSNLRVVRVRIEVPSD